MKRIYASVLLALIIAHTASIPLNQPYKNKRNERDITEGVPKTDKLASLPVPAQDGKENDAIETSIKEYFKENVSPNHSFEVDTHKITGNKKKENQMENNVHTLSKRQAIIPEEVNFNSIEDETPLLISNSRQNVGIITQGITEDGGEKSQNTLENNGLETVFVGNQEDKKASIDNDNLVKEEPIIINDILDPILLATTDNENRNQQNTVSFGNSLQESPNGVTMNAESVRTQNGSILTLNVIRNENALQNQDDNSANSRNLFQSNFTDLNSTNLLGNSTFTMNDTQNGSDEEFTFSKNDTEERGNPEYSISDNIQQRAILNLLDQVDILLNAQNFLKENTIETITINGEVENARLLLNENINGSEGEVAFIDPIQTSPLLVPGNNRISSQNSTGISNLESENIPAQVENATFLLNDTQNDVKEEIFTGDTVINSSLEENENNSLFNSQNTLEINTLQTESTNSQGENLTLSSKGAQMVGDVEILSTVNGQNTSLPQNQDGNLLNNRNLNGIATTEGESGISLLEKSEVAISASQNVDDEEIASRGNVQNSSLPKIENNSTVNTRGLVEIATVEAESIVSMLENSPLALTAMQNVGDEEIISRDTVQNSSLQQNQGDNLLSTPNSSELNSMDVSSIFSEIANSSLALNTTQNVGDEEIGSTDTVQNFSLQQNQDAENSNDNSVNEPNSMEINSIEDLNSISQIATQSLALDDIQNVDDRKINSGDNAQELFLQNALDEMTGNLQNSIKPEIVGLTRITDVANNSPLLIRNTENIDTNDSSIEDDILEKVVLDIISQQNINQQSIDQQNVVVNASSLPISVLRNSIEPTGSPRLENTTAIRNNNDNVGKEEIFLKIDVEDPALVEVENLSSEVNTTARLNDNMLQENVTFRNKNDAGTENIPKGFSEVSNLLGNILYGKVSNVLFLINKNILNIGSFFANNTVTKNIVTIGNKEESKTINISEDTDANTANLTGNNVDSIVNDDIRTREGNNTSIGDSMISNSKQNESTTLSSLIGNIGTTLRDMVFGNVGETASVKTENSSTMEEIMERSIISANDKVTNETNEGRELTNENPLVPTKDQLRSITEQHLTEQLVNGTENMSVAEEGSITQFERTPDVTKNLQNNGEKNDNNATSDIVLNMILTKTTENNTTGIETGINIAAISLGNDKIPMPIYEGLGDADIDTNDSDIKDVGKIVDEDFSVKNDSITTRVIELSYVNHLNSIISHVFEPRNLTNMQQISDKQEQSATIPTDLTKLNTSVDNYTNTGADMGTLDNDRTILSKAVFKEGDRKTMATTIPQEVKETEMAKESTGETGIIEMSGVNNKLQENIAKNMVKTVDSDEINKEDSRQIVVILKIPNTKEQSTAMSSNTKNDADIIRNGKVSQIIVDDALSNTENLRYAISSIRNDFLNDTVKANDTNIMKEESQSVDMYPKQPNNMTYKIIVNDETNASKDSGVENNFFSIENTEIPEYIWTVNEYEGYFDFENGDSVILDDSDALIFSDFVENEKNHEEVITVPEFINYHSENRFPENHNTLPTNSKKEISNENIESVQTHDLEHKPQLIDEGEVKKAFRIVVPDYKPSLNKGIYKSSGELSEEIVTPSYQSVHSATLGTDEENIVRYNKTMYAQIKNQGDVHFTDLQNLNEEKSLDGSNPLDDRAKDKYVGGPSQSFIKQSYQLYSKWDNERRFTENAGTLPEEAVLGEYVTEAYPGRTDTSGEDIARLSPNLDGNGRSQHKHYPINFKSDKFHYRYVTGEITGDNTQTRDTMNIRRED